jgi:hypothetical protein
MGRNCRQCEALLRIVEMQAQALVAHGVTDDRPAGVPTPVASATLEDTPKPIREAIGKRAGRDAHLKYHLGGVAAELLAAGFSELEVAQRILDGDTD